VQFSLELRQALLRNVARQGIRWTGQLDLISFLREVFDLQRMPSRDTRYKTAYDDLWQHTVNNDDFTEDDVLSDPRFDPIVMSDEQFERFLNKALHVDTWLERDGLNTMVETIVPVLAHGGLRLEEHFEFGAFEGYRVAEDRSGIAKAAPSELKVTPSQRMELLQRISSTLQERFTFTEIQAYLGNFAFPKPSKKYDGPNSKRVFANYLLQDAPADQLLSIAEDLEPAPPIARPSQPPANWQGTTRFKL
jgi:hypothetical protein